MWFTVVAADQSESLIISNGLTIEEVTTWVLPIDEVSVEDHERMVRWLNNTPRIGAAFTARDEDFGEPIVYIVRTA